MLNVIEDIRNEFKVKLTDKFEEEVISFLNSSGGNIYIGVNDKGDIIGIKGRLESSNYDDENGKRHFITEVIAERVTFLSSKKSEEVDE